MSRIKIYKDSPTAGGTDGTLVSEGTGITPIESGAIKVAETGYTEGNWIKLALRCDAGFQTVLETARHAQVTIEGGAHVDKWQLAADNAGTPDTPMAWGAALDFLSLIGAVNTIFWAKARVADTEVASNDTTVGIKVSAVVGAV